MHKGNYHPAKSHQLMITAYGDDDNNAYADINVTKFVDMGLH